VVISEPVSVEPPPPRRRRRHASPGPPAVRAPVTRVTVIEGEDLADAPGWLARADLSGVAAGAVAVLVRVVAAHRVAAADPFLADPDPARALAARVGYGSGEQVADGDWEDARALPVGGRPDLRPQQRLAALLAGRDAPLACEELALRARADVDAGRWREAALQLEAALSAALSELQAWPLADRLAELARHREPVAEAAAAARAGTLEPAQTEALREALGRLEAALRARAVAAAE
jgi:hypothetical protein